MAPHIYSQYQIKFSPDRLGVLSLAEISMLRQLNKLTNHGICLSNWLWMQGNFLVFAVLKKSLSLDLEPFLWESCPFAAVGAATASETENIYFWVRQHSAQQDPSEPAGTSPQLMVSWAILTDGFCDGLWGISGCKKPDAVQGGLQW